MGLKELNRIICSSIKLNFKHVKKIEYVLSGRAKKCTNCELFDIFKLYGILIYNLCAVTIIF